MKLSNSMWITKDKDAWYKIHHRRKPIKEVSWWYSTGSIMLCTSEFEAAWPELAARVSWEDSEPLEVKLDFVRIIKGAAK